MTRYDPDRFFGLPSPLVQAPMAGVATPALASAVSNAGGLGSLGIGGATVARARQMIEDTRALTGRPFNVNVFCHAPAHRDAAREAAWLAHLQPAFERFGARPPAHLAELYQSFLADDHAFRMLLETRPAVVSFHFGLPSADRIAAFRGAGIKTMATATSPGEAKAIEAAGIDAIVAQGYEAGGHRGMFDPGAADEKLNTSGLVRLLVQNSDLPVVAAGGIMDGAGMRTALSLGAAGVQLGTAFILCPESSATPGHRRNLTSARAGFTRMTPVISGRPARGIVNELMNIGGEPGSPPPADFSVAYDASKQLNALAASQGNDEFAAHWAGEGAPQARTLPAADLVRVLLAEAGLSPYRQPAV